MRRSLWLLTVLLARPLAADDDFGPPPLTVEQMAAIKADADKTREDLKKQHQGDDSYDGLHELKKKSKAAMSEAIERSGVDKDQFLREYSHADPETKKVIEEKAKGIVESQRKEERAAHEREQASQPPERTPDTPSMPIAEAKPDPSPDDPRPAPAAEPSPEPKPAEAAAEKLPEVVKGFDENDPPDVNAQGEILPKVIRGFDEAHPPADPAAKPK